jgi:uncharacterized protein (DUF427 family)
MILHKRGVSMKAIWNGTVLAESDATITIEGNEYFPSDSVHSEYFVPSDTLYTCPWKGVCTYYTVMVEGIENKDAAFTYQHPKDGSIEKVGSDFTNYVAFWRGVEVS